MYKTVKAYNQKTGEKNNDIKTVSKKEKMMETG